jgi:hypothetical protein
MPGGCVRGEKCFYAHGEETLLRARALPPGDTRHGLIPKQFGGTKVRARLPELSRSQEAIFAVKAANTD